MKTFIGKGVCGAVAIGHVSVFKRNEASVKRTRIDDVKSEKVRLEAAKEKASQQLSEIYNKALKEVGEDNARIFEIHMMMIEDDDYNESIASIIETQSVNAEYAVAVTADNFAEMFASMDDAYMQARSTDVRDISNRIISCLCDGLIVVEAEEVSGTSITANLALEQGKELFAVPGNITSPTSVGTNRLIKSGAVPVTSTEDVLEQFEGYDIKEYNPLPETPDKQITDAEPEEDAPEKLILQAVRTDALTPDEISLKTGLSLAEITGVLTIMEIAGLVEMTPGHKYIKTSKLK